MEEIRLKILAGYRISLVQATRSTYEVQVDNRPVHMGVHLRIRGLQRAEELYNGAIESIEKALKLNIPEETNVPAPARIPEDVCRVIALATALNLDAGLDEEVATTNATFNGLALMLEEGAVTNKRYFAYGVVSEKRVPPGFQKILGRMRNYARSVAKNYATERNVNGAW